jgi:hypothetical protein
LVNELNINKGKEEEELGGGKDINNDNFLDIGRIRLNRKKQKEGLESLKSVSTSSDNSNNKIKAIFTGAAISGLHLCNLL